MRGNRGGFNPFRDAHGRYTTAGEGTPRRWDMNAIIRAATGRRPALSADEPEDEGSDQDRTRQNLGAPPRDE